MPKYKIGDRVMVCSSHHQENGKVGTVIEESVAPWIRFDEPTKFGGGDYDSAGWKAGHMGCIYESKLSLVSVATEQAANEGMVPVSFRIPVELHEALTAKAKEKGYVLPAVVREALSRYVYGA